MLQRITSMIILFSTYICLFSFAFAAESGHGAVTVSDGPIRHENSNAHGTVSHGQVRPTIRAHVEQDTPVVTSTTTRRPRTNMTSTRSSTTATDGPPDVSPRTLLACLMIERGSAGLLYNYDRSAGAIDLGLQYANEQVLRPYNIHLTTNYYDIGSACTPKNHMVAYAMSQIVQNVSCNVYIGLGCAYNLQSLYDIVEFYRIPIIGCPAAGVGTDADLSEYNYMTRISITHTNTADMILRFLNANNYTTPVVIEDQAVSFYQQMSLVTENTFRTKYPGLASRTVFRQINSANISVQFLTTLIQTTVQGSRVFVLLTDAATTRLIMLAAHDLGLTNGDYVYLAVELFSSNSWGYFRYQDQIYPFDGRDQDAKQAFQVLLLLALLPNSGSAYEIFERQVKQASRDRATYNYTFGPTEQVDLVISHFYDAVVYYATIVADISSRGKNIFNIDNVINLINQDYSFYSPIYGMVGMDQNGDRISSYIIKNFNPLTEDFEQAFGLPARPPAFQILGTLIWPNRVSLPPNTPYCGFDGKSPRCAPKPLAGGIVAVAILIPTAAVLAGSITAYIFIKRMLNKNSDPYWWRIFSYELSGINSTVRTRSTAISKSKGSQLKSKKSIQTTGTLQDGATSEATKQEKMSIAADSVYAKYLLFTKTASYKDNSVSLRELPEPNQRVSSTLSSELAPVKSIQHNNLQKFIGIAVSDENLCQYIVGEICSKGSIMTLIEKVKLNLDWEFKNAMIKDTIAGMSYLHMTKVYCHGDLTAHCCLVESRFVVKVTDYGTSYFRDPEDSVPPQDDDEKRDFMRLLWRAPELLRRPTLGGTQKGDVYSFGILLQQLILRSPPYQGALDHQREDVDQEVRSKELVLEIMRGANPPVRPLVPVSSCPAALHEVMESCWSESPDARPPLVRVRESLLKQMGKSGENIVNHLINRMEQYAAELEHEADEKMRQFMEEKQRSEDILNGILPKTISDALRKGLAVFPETFESTTVQFSDIGGFADVLLAAPTPFITIDIMNTLYATCDQVIERYSVYKVETVGDAYLLVSGLPVRNGIKHAGEMATLALHLRKEVGSLKFNSSPDAKLKLRVGINSGPCVASVIGTKMPRYCLFGDTVNTSSRMESHGEAGKIQISPTTKVLLDKLGDYFVTPRGEIEIKGKGVMETFWLVAKTTQ